jgi:acyl-CoA thioesterase-1
LSNFSLAKIKFACIGASDTEGAGSYPGFLVGLLGSGYEVRNFGKGGTTMLKKGDSSYWQDPNFLESQLWLPGIVTIMLGANDSKPQNWAHKADYLSDYKEMIGIYKNLASRPRVYACTPLSVFHEGNFGITKELVDLELLPLIRQAAAETGCQVIETNAATKGLARYFPDNVHPLPEASKIIAQAICQLF